MLRLLFAALGATGSVRATIGAGRRVFAARASASGSGRLATGTALASRGAPGGHQDSSGTNRREEEDSFHFNLLSFVVGWLSATPTDAAEIIFNSDFPCRLLPTTSVDFFLQFFVIFCLLHIFASPF